MNYSLISKENQHSFTGASIHKTSFPVNQSNYLTVMNSQKALNTKATTCYNSKYDDKSTNIGNGTTD